MSDETPEHSTQRPSPRKAPKHGLLFRLARCLILAGVAVTLLFGGILYFNIYLPHGSGPAGPPVPIEPFEKTWSEQPVVLLGLGDSITDGFGAPEGFSFFDRLMKNPDGDARDMLGRTLSAVFPNIKTRKLAVSASNSLQHIAQISQLPTYPPDTIGIVVMTTGGNDLIHHYGQRPPEEGAMYGATLDQARPWIAGFEQRLDRMMQAINAKFPGRCEIFLANIYDPSDGTGNTSYRFTGLPPWPDGLNILAAYNKIIAECARKHDYVHLIDIHTPFLGHGIHCRKFWTPHYRRSDPTYWYYLNIEDPHERGYDAIRRLFLLKMIEVFHQQPAA